MKIYGVALLGICFLTGQFLGEVLGKVLNIDGNVGGVGFAMLFLIIAGSKAKKYNWLTPISERGIMFWSAMYIPVVIAMSATQNVKAALSGGWVAVFVGIIGTAISFICVPLIVKMSKKAKR